MLEELTIEANEESFVIVLQHGGNETLEYKSPKDNCRCWYVWPPATVLVKLWGYFEKCNGHIFFKSTLVIERLAGSETKQTDCYSLTFSENQSTLQSHSALCISRLDAAKRAILPGGGRERKTGKFARHMRDEKAQWTVLKMEKTLVTEVSQRRFPFPMLYIVFVRGRFQSSTSMPTTFGWVGVGSHRALFYHLASCLFHLFTKHLLVNQFASQAKICICRISALYFYTWFNHLPEKTNFLGRFCGRGPAACNNKNPVRLGE